MLRPVIPLAISALALLGLIAALVPFPQSVAPLIVSGWVIDRCVRWVVD